MKAGQLPAVGGKGKQVRPCLQGPTCLPLGASGTCSIHKGKRGACPCHPWGEPGPARDIVQLNAGAAIYTAGLADTLAGGIEKAGEVIASGEARSRLDKLVILSQSFE